MKDFHKIKQVLAMSIWSSLNFIFSYCQSHAQKSLEVLLTGTLADQVQLYTCYCVCGALDYCDCMCFRSQLLQVI